MPNPSRRQVAKFVAEQLANGEPTTRVARVLAAWLHDTKQSRNWELMLRDIETALLRDHEFLAADVVSARALSRETLRDLREMLAAATGAKTVEILPQIDADLIGGVVVRTPESEMDASLRAKLTRLRAI